jgi:hypothetical protein
MADAKQNKVFVVQCDVGYGSLPLLIHLSPIEAKEAKRRKLVIEREDLGDLCSPFACLAAFQEDSRCDFAELEECVGGEPEWYSKSGLPHFVKHVHAALQKKLKTIDSKEESEAEQDN